MWPGLVEWAKVAMTTFEPPLANVEDFDVPKCVQGADEAIQLIREHYSKWLQSKGVR
jgi:hypothetical protein